MYFFFLVCIKIHQRVCECKDARKLTPNSLSILKRSFHCQKERKELKCTGYMSFHTCPKM